jgi:hypothetical protein
MSFPLSTVERDMYRVIPVLRWYSCPKVTATVHEGDSSCPSKIETLGEPLAKAQSGNSLTFRPPYNLRGAATHAAANCAVWVARLRMNNGKTAAPKVLHVKPGTRDGRGRKRGTYACAFF